MIIILFKKLTLSLIQFIMKFILCDLHWFM